MMVLRRKRETRRPEAPEIISRKEAKARGLKRFFSGRPCPSGHVSERLVGNRQCVECARIRRLDYYYKNREAHILYAKKWLSENREYRREYDAGYRQIPEVREARRRAMMKWYRRNREARKQYMNDYYRRRSLALSALKELGIQI